MSCPYFFPLERLEPGGLLMGKPVRVPLGDLYAGECRASEGSPVRPAERELKEFCNFGYAAGRCPRFPRDGFADAARFTITGDAGGDRVQLSFVVEKAHLPYEHGRMEYTVAGGSLCASHPDKRISRQAQAYVESYLRRKPRTA